MDAAVAAREAGLGRRVGERRPGERDVVAPGRARARPASSRRGDRDRSAEAIAAGEQPRISAPAALKLLCPDEYSANGGVGKVVGWYGNQSSPAILCVPLPGPAPGRDLSARGRASGSR